jgi:hypothetical protein
MVQASRSAELGAADSHLCASSAAARKHSWHFDIPVFSVLQEAVSHASVAALVFSAQAARSPGVRAAD